MIKFTASVDIPRPAEELFAYLGDPARMPEYDSSTSEVKLEGFGPIGVGTRFHQIASFMGRRIDNLVVITEYEPGRRITCDSKEGSFPVTWTYTLSPTADGTRVDVNTHGDPKGFFGIAAPLLKTMVRGKIVRELHRLGATLAANASNTGRQVGSTG